MFLGPEKHHPPYSIYIAEESFSDIKRGNRYNQVIIFDHHYQEFVICLCKDPPPVPYPFPGQEAVIGRRPGQEIGPDCFEPSEFVIRFYYSDYRLHDSREDKGKPWAAQVNMNDKCPAL
jgi:hypothetical protein